MPLSLCYMCHGGPVRNIRERTRPLTAELLIQGINQKISGRLFSGISFRSSFRTKASTASIHL